MPYVTSQPMRTAAIEATVFLVAQRAQRDREWRRLHVADHVALFARATPPAARAITAAIDECDGLGAAAERDGGRSASPTSHPERQLHSMAQLTAAWRDLERRWHEIATHAALGGPESAREAVRHARHGLSVCDAYTPPQRAYEPKDRCVGSKGEAWDVTGLALECWNVPARNRRADGTEGGLRYPPGLCTSCYARRRRWLAEQDSEEVA
jgi:hypothetical protein